MIALGVLLVIIGVGSLALPYLQVTLLDSIEAYQPWIGIIVAAVGLITVLFGAQRRGRAAAPVAAAAAPAAPPAERDRPTEPPERSED